jgi:hypothetical protein
MISRVMAAAAAAAVAVGCSGEAHEGVDVETAALVNVAEAQTLLYEDRPAPTACATGGADQRVECLIVTRYASDPAARDVALSLFRETGGVPGVLPAQDYDGGYRGQLRFVPALPVGGLRDDLVWARDAMRDIDGLFRSLSRSTHAPIRYRWQNVDLQFFRSVGRTTPSAFVTDDGKWRFSYNVAGSLNSSELSVRETLFHELFHKNDWADADWSARMLAPIVASIVVRCGTGIACLAPFTPTDLVVPGGTYYAFQPGPPTALEYAAELAVRYQQEQRARIEGRAFPKPPFKCGPPENARAWELIKDEFFGGADLVPTCAR